jgi:hypothetical protein
VKKTIATANAVEAAYVERLAAEQHHADAVALSESKRGEAVALHERAASGETVTGLDLLTVQADADLLDGRVGRAAEALRIAREAEAAAVAAEIAGRIADAFDLDAFHRAEQEAVEVIASALGKLAGQRTTANAALVQGLREAREAGVTDTSPGRVRLRYRYGRPADAAASRRAVVDLVVDGRMRTATKPTQALLDVLSAATRKAGYRLDVEHGRVAVQG